MLHLLIGILVWFSCNLIGISSCSSNSQASLRRRKPTRSWVIALCTVDLRDDNERGLSSMTLDVGIVLTLVAKLVEL